MFFLLCLLAATPTHDPKPTPLIGGERFALPSRIMGEDRTIYVTLPRGYQTQQKSYPVVYMTDGQTHLDHTTASIAFLAENGRMPEMIVVAVANTQRTRDLTPPPNPGKKVCCGADRFLDFFEKELFAEIDKRYRTQPFRVFAGHSYGGLFAVHAFLSRNEVFQAYLAVSPTLFWADHDPVERLDRFLKNRTSLASSLVVVQGNEHPKMNPPFREFVDILGKRRIDGFFAAHRQIDDEDHGSVVLRANYWGLQQIFSFWPITPETQKGGLAEHLDHFKKISQRMGYPVTMTESHCNRLGYQLLQQGDQAAAIEAFLWNTSHYPSSANAFDSLAEAYEERGDLDKALANYRKALQLAQQNREETGYYRNNVARIVAKKKP
ncbi:alpha/beta hydrolase-fold protein [Sulfidibacter corallicola]|uniref:Esterase n=1 Tax=Sulfidibacter corallicola TaxID=2818388 RepID=A0A8A4TGY4_SULCO|nr:alpha/beta hydrolase-fold protein [Sulfidibacter corallicola]QTD49329.1 hypothetical protein J3U87_27405 [Sulfidibacter corallicola]